MSNCRVVLRSMTPKEFVAATVSYFEAFVRSTVSGPRWVKISFMPQGPSVQAKGRNSHGEKSVPCRSKARAPCFIGRRARAPADPNIPMTRARPCDSGAGGH